MDPICMPPALLCWWYRDEQEGNVNFLLKLKISALFCDVPSLSVGYTLIPVIPAMNSLSKMDPICSSPALLCYWDWDKQDGSVSFMLKPKRWASIQCTLALEISTFGQRWLHLHPGNELPRQNGPKLFIPCSVMIGRQCRARWNSKFLAQTKKWTLICDIPSLSAGYTLIPAMNFFSKMNPNRLSHALLW